MVGLTLAGGWLFTTREGSLALTFAGTRISVDELTQKQALELLGGWMGQSVGELPPEARALCTRVGNLALGVAMAGAMIAQARSIADVLTLIEKDLNRVRAEMDPAYAYRTLSAAIEAGISDLPDTSQRHYEQLAVFAGHGPFTREAAAALWQADMAAAGTGGLLSEPAGRSLLSEART